MGNPHRKRGTGKGTASSWRSVGLEGEPVSTEVFVQPHKKEPEKNIIDFPLRKSVKADSVHSGPSFPMYRTGPTPETAARKPLTEESDEEKIAKLEEKIQSNEFSDEEREYVDHVTEDYSKELQAAKKKMKDKGAKTDDKWAHAVRQIYITDRIRFGLDKKRWGMHGPLAPEKAEIFEKYLNLKLPVGIPEEKNNENINNLMKEIPLTNIDGQEIKTEFSPDQIKELDDFCAVIKEEYSERFFKGNFRERTFLWEVQAAFRVIFKGDYVQEGVFSETDEETAIKFITEKVKEDIKI